MRLSLVPRERRFYELFGQHSDAIVRAAEQLDSLLRDLGDLIAVQGRIKALEHQGDEITHEIVRTLNRTFVTPFDREDIYALCSGMDDILDYIDEVANTLVLYGFTEVTDAAREMSGLILRASRELLEATLGLERQQGLEAHWIEIHRLENLGDECSRRAIGDLFRNGRLDPVEIIKLKDLYGILESALDRCEDVANVIESITIKNA